MIRQLPLELPHRPSFADEDFLAAPCNAKALALLDLWPDWPHRLVTLAGPEGSGKSHLAAIWARRAGARIIAARDLRLDHLPELAEAPALVLEDADSAPVRETELFHLINLAMERGTFVLVTARKAPDAWGVKTRDLLSRLRRALLVMLEQPDETFLRAILVKLFQDRQIKVEATLIDYLVVRLERSYRAAQSVVAALDSEGLARGRAITRALAAELIAADPERVAPDAPDESD